MKIQKLNEKILNLIIMVQGYKKNIINQNMFNKSIGMEDLEKDWYKETKNFYNAIGDTVLNTMGLSTNIISFEKVLDYKVTEEMRSILYENLDKFTF